MLVRDGRVHALQRHLDRLAHSAGALYGMRLPRDLRARAHAEASGLAGEHRLRIDVVPATGVSITTGAVAAGSRQSVALEPLVVPGGLGQHKWRDRRLLDSSGFNGVPTPLLVDADGAVLEAAWGNFWVLDGDALITPPTDGRILPGVTRSLLLELAPSLGLGVCEEPIGLHDAQTAPVTFATSAIRLAVPATLHGTAAAPTARVDHIRTALAAHW
jgi:para-aminobenzoate synthetase/4-amino-4-deoxychorismate lyase